MVIKSNQTASGGHFRYNRYAGADIHLFPVDRPQEMPRVYPLHPDYDTGGAYACKMRVQVTVNTAGQTECLVNGKLTNRFSVVYPSKRKRKPFAMT